MPSEYQSQLDGQAQSPTLTAEFDTAAPGSTVRVVGQHFAQNSSLTLLLSGQPLATVQSAEDGSFLYELTTAGEGMQTVTVADHPTAAVQLQVGQELPLRTVEEGEYPEEKNIGSNRVYLPVIVTE